MINLILSLCLVFSSCIMVAMEPVTQEENTCMQWWCEQGADLRAKSWALLSQEDRNILGNEISPSQQLDKVTQALQNYVAKFCNVAKSAQIPLKYDRPFLGKVLLKSKIAVDNYNYQSIKQPTDYVTARMFVFSQHLTKEERSTILRENYIKNPQEAHAMLTKAGKLLAEELVKLNLIADNDDAKEETAHRYTAMKIKDLEKMCKS